MMYTVKALDKLHGKPIQCDTHNAINEKWIIKTWQNITGKGAQKFCEGSRIRGTSAEAEGVCKFVKSGKWSRGYHMVLGLPGILQLCPVTVLHMFMETWGPGPE